MTAFIIGSFNQSFPSLIGKLEDQSPEYFLLLPTASDVVSPALSLALEHLESSPDTACIGRADSQYYKLAPRDAAGVLEYDGVLFRTRPVLELWKKGFRPCFSLFELSSALRQAGWRVAQMRYGLSCGSGRELFRTGRELATGRLYDRVVEQILAGGPRRLKGTLLWELFQCGQRWYNGSPPLQEMGSALQTVLNRVERNERSVRATTWASTLDFHFPKPSADCSTVVLLFTALRPWYLRRALRALRNHWPGPEMKLVVSQDGDEPATESLVRSLGSHVEHWRFTEPLKIPLKNRLRGHTPYYRIAQHYGYALRRAFDMTGVKRVIVLEDDLQIEGDFFSYLEACREILDLNSDLLAASAWNDNSHLNHSDVYGIQRTDCFPGLGWLIQRDGWDYLESKWPTAFWDEWLREPTLLAGRQFLRPDVSRVTNFGRSGTGSSVFFEQYIETNSVQKDQLDWTKLDKDSFQYANYRDLLMERIDQAQCVSEPKAEATSDIKIYYQSRDHFNELAESVGALPGFRPHAPRAAFEGVVILGHGNFYLYLVPESWAELEPGR